MEYVELGQVRCTKNLQSDEVTQTAEPSQKVASEKREITADGFRKICRLKSELFSRYAIRMRMTRVH